MGMFLLCSNTGVKSYFGNNYGFSSSMQKCGSAHGKPNACGQGVRWKFKCGLIKSLTCPHGAQLQTRSFSIGLAAEGQEETWAALLY
jgi:hypothetical protein